MIDQLKSYLMLFALERARVGVLGAASGGTLSCHGKIRKYLYKLLVFSVPPSCLLPRSMAILLLLLAALTAGLAFPLSCTAGTYLGCFNDSARPVPFLAEADSRSLTLDLCALQCGADGFPVLAATANPAAAFCYCGPALNPHAARLPDAFCALPCPGNPAQRCGAPGASAAWTAACDGPLPPPPVGALGPPLPAPACSAPASRGWPFCNASLGVEARLDDLMSRIAVSEYGAQLTARASAPIPRLGMSTFMWGTNSVHGITDYAGCRPTTGRCPTTWPNGVSLGATWNRSAWRAMGAVTGTELRAYDNLEWRANAVTGSGPVGGPCAWGPTINVQRDGRWGRGQESFSEDPYLLSRAAVEITRGLQEGEDPHHMLAVTTLKHAFAYSLEQWTDSLGNFFERQTFNALVSTFDLKDTYTVAFQAAISEARAAGIMYSANALNGVPLCVDAGADALLDSWVQPGAPFYRATDGGQIQNAVSGHHYVPTLDAAIGLAAAAESDIADGEEYSVRLLAALCNGNATLAAVQRLVRNTLRIRMALGIFDPVDSQPYLTYGDAHIASAAANASVVSASREGMVLLKNEAGTLPLRPLPPAAAAAAAPAPPLASLAVVGPCADDMLLLGGNYLGAVCPNGPHGPASDCHPSILGALLARAPDALYAAGGDFNNTSPPELAAAAAAAAGAARTVLCLGLDKTLEREQLDRSTTALPDAQAQLFRAVEGALAGSGRALVVVLIHGGALSIDEVAASPAVGAILDALLPGCASGGEAVAGALFGDFSPSGKLPYTVPFANWSALSNFTDMAIAPTPQSPLGRTYRYATQPPLYRFGYGLSFSDFSLTWEGGGGGGGGGGGSGERAPVSLSPASPPLLLAFAVRNTGGFAAGEVAQLYFSPLPGTLLAPPPHVPLAQLWEFERTRVLAPGEAQVLAFNLTAQALALTTADGSKAVLAGVYNVSVSRGHGQALWLLVNVTGA